MAKESFKSAVYIILKDNNKVLFQRRKNTELYLNKLGLPAGHIKPLENAFEAIKREVKEEINIDVEKEDIINTLCVQRRTKTHGSYYDVYFEFSKYKGIIKNNEPFYASELVWEDIDNLSEDVIDYEKKAISQYKKGIKFDCLDDTEE